MRILFVCDIHGSEQCWKKFLNIKFYEKYGFHIDYLMCLGDLTGKALIPIIEGKGGLYRCSFMGKNYILKSDAELEEMKKIIRFGGFYPRVCSSEEAEELEIGKKLNEVFERLAVENMERWLAMAEEHVPEHIKIIVSPGNDDTFKIDDVLKNSDRVIYPLKKVVWLDDTYPMISCEWVTLTPWKTPRECTEDALEEKLEKEFSRISNYGDLVCNFHCPPHETILDRAPKLDEDLKPVVRGQVEISHVGSIAVRKAIERYQPLISLHGHIHESPGYQRIGRTLCLNPGSEYGEGILRAYIITLGKKGIESFFPIRG
jgi:Icc-related predicted phosphoesterase